MTLGQPSRVGTPSGGSRSWYPLALFATLLVLLVALVLAGAGTAAAGPVNAESARGTVHTVHTGAQPSEGGDAVRSITAISLIPPTSKALDGADAAVPRSLQVSLIPPTSRALPTTRAPEVAVRNAAFDRIEPTVGALGPSDGRPGIRTGGLLLVAVAILLGGAAVVTIGRVRRRRQH